MVFDWLSLVMVVVMLVVVVVDGIGWFCVVVLCVGWVVLMSCRVGRRKVHTFSASPRDTARGYEQN